ncbi:hypothetical protein H6CHR_01529 [Variovorax sp. PBL-H6]|nr:hypothetical protein H6CHR_01529 [Variovorax sp. PBL-H6]
MANLAELKLTFSQPCKRCAQLLYGRVKFCPYCGGESDAPRWGDEAANTAFGPGRAASDTAEPVASLADEFPAMPEDEAGETTDGPIAPELRNEAREELGLDIAHIVPAAFEWPDELPLAITTAQPRAPALHRRPILKYTAIGVGMAVSALALVLGYIRTSQEGDARRSQAPMAQPVQAQIAPRLAAAASPAESRTEPPQAVQAPAAAPVPVVPVAAATAVPASPMPAPETAKAACNEALAALALCPDAGAAR